MRLIIKNDLEILLDLEYKNGELITNYIEETLVTALDRWKLQGISEWITRGEGSERDTYPRVTLASDKNFLFRLKDYLNYQFTAFEYYLEERS
jgi:hypothetical protein